MGKAYDEIIKMYMFYSETVWACKVLDAYAEYFQTVSYDLIKNYLERNPAEKHVINLKLACLELFSENLKNVDRGKPYAREDADGFRYNEKGTIVCCPTSFYDDIKEKYVRYKMFFDKYL